MRDLSEVHDTCDKACTILKLTNDGDALAPSDLKLTELAVNGALTDKGKKVFDDLYKRVKHGTYTKPFLNGVEPFTMDHEGYVYYKNIHVEHFTGRYANTEDAKQYLLELGRHCRFLERKGIEINSGTAVWRWEEHEDEYCAERRAELDALLARRGACGVNYSKVEVYCAGITAEYFMFGNPTDLEEIRNHPITQGLASRDSDSDYQITIETFCYGNPAAPLRNTDEELPGLLQSCHKYLERNELLVIGTQKKYLTDFAAGYENTRKLNALLGSGKRVWSMEYSEIFLWADNNVTRRFFMYGKPALEEIKKHFEYEMLESSNIRSVTVATYQYRKGKSLPVAELPPIDALEGLLFETHKYLQKVGLVQQTAWESLL